MRQLTVSKAINEAYFQAMEADNSVFAIGLGVPDPKGVFGTTAGLRESFGPNRVFDSPTAENGVTGACIGAALTGARPVITHQRVEFGLLAVEQLVNQAAKWNYMTAGKKSVPMVVRMIVGRGWGQGPQHSQSLESWFAHIPGLKVVAPSTAYNAKGLLISAIADDNPIVFLEHRWLHNHVGDVPAKPYDIEIGKGRIAKSGDHVTIVAYSYMVNEALRASAYLSAAGIEAEVIDLCSLRPIDYELIKTSVMKTGRLIAIDNSWKVCGIGSDIVSVVSETCFDHLVQAPTILSLAETPIPSTPALANFVYVSVTDIIQAAEKVCQKQTGIDFASLPAVTDKPDEAFTGPF